MQIEAIKLPLLEAGFDLLATLDAHIPELPEQVIIAISSKIVSLSESRTVSPNTIDKAELIKREADSYVPGPQGSAMMLTCKHGIIVPAAGIDESNGNGSYVLYPANPMRSAELIWRHLKDKHGLSSCGVLITDSTITPLRRGTIGVGLAWCGFASVYDYRGQQDCFGRTLQLSTVNNVDALAAAAVFVMGEGAEHTPISIIRNIPRVQFVNHPPSAEELALFAISAGEDLYAQLFDNRWESKIK